MDDDDKKMLFQFLAPYFVGVVILAVFVTMLCFRFVPYFKEISSPRVVTFDVIKYVNAQRSVASAFIGRSADDKAAEANELLYKLSDRTKNAIRKAAGDNTVVVIKQAVVQGSAYDITDAVLKEVGLPVDVPTQDAVRAVLDPLSTQSLLTDKGPLKPPTMVPEQAKEEEAAAREAAKNALKNGSVPQLP